MKKQKGKVAKRLGYTQGLIIGQGGEEEKGKLKEGRKTEKKK